MAINCNIEIGKDIMFVEAWGEDENLEDAQNYAAKVIGAGFESNKKKFLIDETRLIYKLSSPDTYKLLKFSADRLPNLIKVALIYNPVNVKTIDMWETGINYKGVSAMIFESKERAMDWLNS
jgi:hypothetical protein